MSVVQETNQPEQVFSLVRDLSGRLLIYPLEGKKSGERIVIRGAFILAATGVGVFSLTRLLLIHWVWLVPVSVGSMALLMIVLLFFRFRERPFLALQVTSDALCLEDFSSSSGLFRKKPVISRYALSDVMAETLGSGVPPDGFRMMTGNRILFECRLHQVKDVSLYLGICRYFSMDPDCRPSIPPGKAAISKKTLFWFLLAWGLIVVLMVAWSLFENWMLPRNYGPFSNP